MYLFLYFLPRNFFNSLLISITTSLFLVLFLLVMLQVLYKLKTAKVFDRNRSKEDKGSTEVSDEDPFAIQIMAWCPESRMLCVAGVSANVIVYRFSKLEVTTEVVQVGLALTALSKFHVKSKKNGEKKFYLILQC